jgi:hypothetical protein
MIIHKETLGTKNENGNKQWLSIKTNEKNSFFQSLVDALRLGKNLVGYFFSSLKVYK